jgi:hypothetical protein
MLLLRKLFLAPNICLLRNASLVAMCLLPLSAHALIISDVISVNKILAPGWVAFEFDLAKQGYNHKTDTIKFVELSYDFSKMIDEYDDYEDPTTVESIQLNSYIFDGRTIIYDINPEIITQRFSWQKDESHCEKENYDTGECEFNLDLNGTAKEYLSTYSPNIYLGDVTFSVEVDRIEVPEPSPFILFGVGLLAAGFARGRRSVRQL